MRTPSAAGTLFKPVRCVATLPFVRPGMRARILASSASAGVTTDAPEGHEFVFSYGSNSPSQLMTRLRQGKAEAEPFVFYPAVLTDHVRVFAGHSKTWGGAVASVHPAAGQQVHGLVAQLTSDELVQLDTYEQKMKHLIRRLSRVADSSSEFSIRRSTSSFRNRRGHHRLHAPPPPWSICPARRVNTVPAGHVPVYVGANVWSGNKINPKILDRFTLVIPYCLETIKWDVIYNSEYAMDPPDFVFGPDDEDFVPCKCSAIAPDDDQISSLEKALSEWDHEDSTRLLVIIQGLRDQYVAYQRRRVGQVDDDRVKFEISTVLTRKGIEMQMASGVDKCSQRKSSLQYLL